MTTTATKIPPRERITHFRMIVHSWVPYLSPYVYQLHPVETPGIGTMAVDKQGRMYYDPKFVDEVTNEQGAYVVLHEAVHLILRHCHRAKSIIGDKPHPNEQLRLNIAYDLVIWEFLESWKEHGPDGIVDWPRMKAAFPRLQRNMLPEQIYAIMLEAAEKRPCRGNCKLGATRSGQSNGSKGRGKGGSGSKKECGCGDFVMIGGGSAADGQTRDYEDEPNPNWDAFLEDSLLDAVEKKMEEERRHVTGRGTLPGEVATTIRRKLRPQPSPWDKLRASVSRAAMNPKGAKDYTYQRVNRRQFAMPNAPRLKGCNHWTPRVAVVMDTSGSMTPECKRKCIEVIAQGLRAVGDFPVIFGDTIVQRDVKFSRLTDEVEFVGGGGTDMRVLIEHAEKKYHPEAIIIGTDGGTPWPSSPTKAQLIVAMTQPVDGPPWATVVRIPDDPTKDEIDE